MATTITVGGTDIDYRDFSIEVPVSSVGIAPEASLVANARESITAGDSVTITIDGTTAFEGTATSGGTKSELGGLQVDCEHAAVEMFGELVDLSITSSTTSENILQSAVSATTNGSNFTVTVNATGASLPSYTVSNRPVKQIFRDVCDRNGWVWWVDPASNTITVDVVGGRGLWKALDTETDRMSVQQFDTGDVETVRNTVTVVGTGADAVEATATDSTSVSTYGTRTGESPYNVSYIESQTEAQAFADALLVPDPLAEGKLLVGQNVGDVVQPLANYTVDVTDDAKDISASGLAIEKQTIEQGRATLQVGEGSGTSISEINRRARNRDDLTNPGSGVGDDSIGSDELVDGSVIEAKLADLAVTLAKVAPDAIDETKITDNAVTTPKLNAGAVVADKIQSDTITANEIFSLELDTGDLTIGTDADNQIEFGTFSDPTLNLDFVEMYPSTDDSSYIGRLNNRFDRFYGTVLDLEDPAGSNGLVLTSFGSGPAEIEPTTDAAAELGTTLRKFGDVHTQNLWVGNQSVLDPEDGEATFWPQDSTESIRIRDQNGDAAIVPDSDGECQIGANLARWSLIVGQNANFEPVESEDPMEITNTNLDDVTIQPTGDRSARAGTSGNAFVAMRAANFITDSPDPLAQQDIESLGGTAPDGGESTRPVDLDELTDCSWYENPPEYVAAEQQRRADDPGRDGSADDHGVELGHMSNYLLEVTKALAAERDAMADRIDDLESRLSALEGDNA